MKRLSILRHAKSSWDNRALADFDRPLNNRGWKAARRLGCEIKDRGMHFDLCVASTAARVRETLDGLLEGYGEPDFEVRFEPEIYDASFETLLDVVRGFPETSSAALLVGHNPGVHQLVLGLARHRRDGLRARVAEKFPTAALATLKLSVERWDEVKMGCGEIADAIMPKELD